ncbi:MAG: xanthine phosphoribosyltransferase [Micavibrio aeruginosavorus]|uniref:Xanthine phosphoribosyltransferase n=1 Tax=Micavibrio aeruginosavorus TaxID=349221 RepID=A0A2W5Q3E6_9BACT|nr:MAG: xanthine phosphoribosyltransferase [Micavibrio aeruginosavorus]
MGDQAGHNKDFPVSWAEAHRNARALAWRLAGNGPLEEGKWKGIVAVTRGGMVPACIVARELDILLIETFCVVSYGETGKGQELGKSNVLKVSDKVEKEGEGWLVVDDLVDSGSTFRIIRKHLPKAHFAAIYAKPAGVDTIDTYISELSQDTWVHFPWEVDPPAMG